YYLLLMLDLLTKSELLISPDVLDGLGSLNANSAKTAQCLPIADSLDSELCPHLFKSIDELVLVLGSMTWSRSNSKTFLSDWNGWVVDCLNVNLMVVEEFVRGLLG